MSSHRLLHRCGHGLRGCAAPWS